MKTFIQSVLFITFYAFALVGFAQKGAGDAQGVSSQGLNPELLEMEGTIERIASGPCKYTTGRAAAGTHLFVKTQETLVNVHLGPSDKVFPLFTATEGDRIAMTLFRTDKLPPDEYIAKEVSINGKTTVLRDGSLKPMWAGKHKEKWRKGKQPAPKQE
ncbi:MAG: hypothetical protein RIC30_12165 [Marinoscillum sp.]|uniref:hypothetical protein n=1 Tax=Marinoscillum sp. TaxID=2024838 RepID=UPI0032FD0AB9